MLSNLESVCGHLYCQFILESPFRPFPLHLFCMIERQAICYSTSFFENFQTCLKLSVFVSTRIHLTPLSQCVYLRLSLSVYLPRFDTCLWSISYREMRVQTSKSAVEKQSGFGTDVAIEISKKRFNKS